MGQREGEGDTEAVGVVVGVREPVGEVDGVMEPVGDGDAVTLGLLEALSEGVGDVDGVICGSFRQPKGGARYVISNSNNNIALQHLDGWAWGNLSQHCAMQTTH